MGGTDDPSNLVLLSVEDHAEEHKWLFIEHGRWQDAIAWMFLSRQISSAEATHLAIVESNKCRDRTGFKNNHGRILSEVTKQKISRSNKGKTAGDKNASKRPEVRQQISAARMGNPGATTNNCSHRPEVRAKQSAAALLRRKVTCNVCGKEGSISPMSRWHFENCRNV